jgi:hypothetical protein
VLCPAKSVAGKAAESSLGRKGDEILVLDGTGLPRGNLVCYKVSNPTEALTHAE